MTQTLIKQCLASHLDMRLQDPGFGPGKFHSSSLIEEFLGPLCKSKKQSGTAADGAPPNFESSPWASSSFTKGLSPKHG